MEEKLNEMEQAGIITRTSTPYSSPLTFTLKKDGSIRVLLDARSINKKMVAETEKPPIQLDVLNSFHGANYITTIDLNNAYFQIPINKDGRKYTGFTFNGKSYVYNVLPQGLKTLVESFSRAMNLILGPEVQEFCVNYLDNLAIITTGTLDKHLEHIDIVLSKLNKAGLTCNLQKCEFICKEIKMLGFIISTEGIKTDPDKIRAIQEFPAPKKIKQLRAFLGLCNFYRRFIPNYSESIIPLCDLLKKGRKFQWSGKEQKAFDFIKQQFINTIQLHHPDFNKPYYLQTDCSGVGMAGVLYQIDDNNEMRILGYYSKALKGPELNWSVTEQEFYAVISCLKKFETYLRGSKVIILTDHKALLFINNMKLFNGRVTRWILYIEQFNYEVQHISGRRNIVADVLSRYPPDGDLIQEDKNNSLEIAYTESEPNIELIEKLKSLTVYQLQDSESLAIIEKLKTLNTSIIKQNNKFKRYSLKNDVLYYKTNLQEVIYLPKALRQDIINQVHVEMGHQGPYKVIKYVRDRFFWKGLTKDIKNQLRACHLCQLSKKSNITYVGPCKSIITENIGDIVMADLYGPLVSGTFGYTFIFVIQDSFSKFIKLYPLKQSTAKSVVTKVKHFVEIIKPKAIMTDNGKQFVSNHWKQSMSELNIKPIYTTVRNPRPNTTERVNKELSRLFRTLCHTNHKDWALILPKLEELYNNSYHNSTGFTPCEILYGESNEMSFDKVISKSKDKHNVEQIRQQVRKNLKEASRIRNTKFDKRNRLIKYNIGDLVKISRYSRSDADNKVMSKFNLAYEGPYVIAAVPFDNVYTLANPETNEIRGIFNAIHLLKYFK
ncbi:unnamed protein product [Parnassius mnemosyne]|uniref:RNA-directed DNA polymerase n=1 Tax=Parnassius mnemosyne TaxID=213953 RepID=A0AAV1KIQ1_9NEOP